MNTYLDVDAEREHDHANRRIVFRTQSAHDRDTLAKLCARDRDITMTGRWESDGVFVLEQAPEVVVSGAGTGTGGAGGGTLGGEGAAGVAIAAERKRLLSLPEKELKTLAGERGVTWDKKVSPETMAERVLAAAPIPPAA